MKKIKVLLLGKSNIVMDDFFNHTQDAFEMQSSSMRREDIQSHIQYFKPEVVVYCIYQESRENYNLIKSVKNHNIPIIVVGDASDCDDFESSTMYTVDLILRKPITIRNIQDEISKYVVAYYEKLEKEKQEKAAEEERLRRRHILIIDDDATVLRMIKELLKEEYDVATAINGKIALNFLSNKKTDLILLDYEMPVEDGPTVFGKIREIEQHVNTPVVFLTGITEKEKIAKALVMKPQGYLLKPIDQEKLFSTIEGLVR